MGKLQIGLIVLLIAIIDISSLQAAKQNTEVETPVESPTNISSNADEIWSMEEDISDSENIEEEIQPCTCGIFLSGKYKNKTPYNGFPILTKELDVVFQCTPLGVKQCQNKCVEIIIKHLPKSNDILCASIDRDIHKEKAHLFVQNCDTTWHNTKLSAGKEFCCKDNVPYKCPLF